MKKAFTLAEILLVVAILAILIVTAITLLNPMEQINKSLDARRKSDLNLIKKALEDFYNDQGRYPRASEICYDSPSTRRTDSEGREACSCHICGTIQGSPNLRPYLTDLICDPQHPKYDYLYDYNCTDATNTPLDSYSPQWYRIYTHLRSQDQQALEAGCTYGKGDNGLCGPASTTAGYSYGATSPNTKIETSPNWYRCVLTGAQHMCQQCCINDPQRGSCSAATPQGCQAGDVIYHESTCGGSCN